MAVMDKGQFFRNQPRRGPYVCAASLLRTSPLPEWMRDRSLLPKAPPSSPKLSEQEADE